MMATNFNGSDFNVIDAIDISRTALILLNPYERIFSNVFSKLEFLNAFSYIRWLSQEWGIPILRVDVIGEKNRLSDYVLLKQNRNLQRAAPRSMLDGDFNSRFSVLIRDLEPVMRSDTDDIFEAKAVANVLLNGQFENILITGFLLDRTILRVALSAIDHGILPIVVSDATSTYSERIYYECLDVISQTAEVIDSRDLMRRWPEQ